MSLLNRLNALKNHSSDINEHLETLYTYGSLCDSVVEFGTGGCSSTTAFLSSNAKSVISYDINEHENVSVVQKIALEDKKNFTFIRSSSLDAEFNGCDLLFIDSLHTYDHLLKELTKYSCKVNKYIIMHDTVSFGEKGEMNTDGLNKAIKEFLSTSKEWAIDKIYTNNNGLTILKRI